MRALVTSVVGLLLVSAGTAQAATFNEKVTINWGVQPLLVTDGAGNNLFAIEKGAAEGPEFPTVAIPNGDIINVRNIQGGMLTNEPDDLNLDIGAGNDVQRGNITLNYDVGNGTEIYNGRTARVADFNEAGARVSRFWGDVYTQNGARIVLNAGQPNFNVTLRPLEPTPNYGTRRMMASDAVIVSGQGYGGNFEFAPPPCAVNARLPWYDVGGKRVGWIPIAYGC